MTKTLYLVLALCVFSSALSSAQTNIVISKPQLEFKDNNIIVLYNIMNAEDSQDFQVWLDVSDSAGNIIEAKALSGDVGNNINGGSDKQIFWNLTADNIYIDALLSVKINAELMKEGETTSRDPGPATTLTNEYEGIKRSGLYIQSLLIPGWGLSRINKGPHWLKGVAAYGCLTGSIVYNVKASNTYLEYLAETEDGVESERLINLSEKQDKISEGLAIAGAAIWALDMIWTIAGSQKIKNSMRASGISIEPHYESTANAPVIAFKYSF